MGENAYLIFVSTKGGAPMEPEMQDEFKRCSTG